MEDRNNSYMYLRRAAKHLVAGGCAGFSEICIMHPLDVIKTRFQIQGGSGEPNRYTSILDCTKKMMKSEGPLSVYKGIVPPLLVESPKRAAKFFSFEFYKSILNAYSYTGPWSLVLAGLGSGLTEGVIVTPFERVKVHLQAQKNIMSEQPSTWTAAREIVRKDGFGTKGLFKGFTATLGRNGLWNTVYFGTYYNMKNFYFSSQDPSIPTKFMIGLLAGSLASLSNLPIDVAKSRIQAPQPHNNPNKYRTLWVTMVTVYREEGFFALYRGLVPKVLRLGPGGAIMFVVYEQVSSFLEAHGL